MKLCKDILIIVILFMFVENTKRSLCPLGIKDM